jgi:hypothetical protein
MRGNRWVRDDDVPRRERGRHLPDDIEKGVVVGDEDLNVIAHFRELGGRADKIRHRPRVPIPNENVEAQAAEILRDAATDNTEPDYANIFSDSTRHAIQRRFGRCSACGENRHRAIQKLAI